MKIYLKEKIGNPDMFSGRNSEVTFFLNWINRIKRELSRSMALLSRRKTGKTALLQRLYNLTFEKNDNVIPFYYEVKEGHVWAIKFCTDFFLTFIYQYIAFKIRKPEYIEQSVLNDFEDAIISAKKEGLDYLVKRIEAAKRLALNEDVDSLWTLVREAPRMTANAQGEFIVQIIDEFQYLNSEIYWDKEKTNPAPTFAAGYMSTAEYKNAPLLISGSWVGWLGDLLLTMLPSRFIRYGFENLPEEESIEMIYNYSNMMDIPVTEETAMILTQLCEGNPFYISSMFQSSFADKDFTNQEGVLKTIEFETLNERGIIKSVWMEYILSVFGRVNELNSKNIVLYLSKHRERQVTRKELLQKLNLDMTDFELEQKLIALEKVDIIEQGRSNFFYQGVQDNIFDKVFRGRYADDIEEFDPKEITNEYKALFAESQKQYRKLMGRYNRDKGLYAEYLIINQLRYNAYKKDQFFQSFTNNLPKKFKFIEYAKVWSYKASPVDKRDINIDIFARVRTDQDQENYYQENYSLICEVKNRKKKFSKQEAVEFSLKMKELIKIENIKQPLGFVFSITGFTSDALEFFRENNFAWSDDIRWFGEDTKR
ncbi:MAG: hypothetical protein U9N77_02065 [Thermodesulfobacteriota bacterium]|nr:hypothetical protein [Thermodesulfobacteriota bacterium]